MTGVKAAQYEEPRLTTYGQNIEAMGREAALRLIEEIEHPMTTVPGIHTVSGHADGRADRKAVASVRLTGFVIAGFSA